MILLTFAFITVAYVFLRCLDIFIIACQTRDVPRIIGYGFVMLLAILFLFMQLFHI